MNHAPYFANGHYTVTEVSEFPVFQPSIFTAPSKAISAKHYRNLRKLKIGRSPLCRPFLYEMQKEYKMKSPFPISSPNFAGELRLSAMKTCLIIYSLFYNAVQFGATANGYAQNKKTNIESTLTKWVGTRNSVLTSTGIPF
jgi:hypothetical protein